MEQYNKLYRMSYEIYDLYRQNDMNKLKKIIDEENKLYENYNSQQLLALLDYIYWLNGEKALHYLCDYELPLYDNKKRLIIGRVINKLVYFINRSFLCKKESSLPIKDVLLLDKNITFVAENTACAFSELYNKITTQIETKYLYFIFDSNELDDEKKKEIFLNSLFINPLLEEKLLKPTLNLADFIKKEDNLYNGLWENIKETYKEYLEYQCRELIFHNIDRMLSEIDCDNIQNVVARSIYLRTAFNYLEENVLEDINYNYKEQERKVANPVGDEYIRNSFRKINKDKEQIQKIKTR